ncbi:MAG: 30S ribosomal protein S20 [Proteobacteria bacterium]|nr:30S ribosomal protein S20 [Pseudomonadota bacterium]
MAHHQSAKKRVRQSTKRRAQNRAYMSSLRTSLKRLHDGIEQKKSGEDTTTREELMKLFRHSQSLLMKCVTKKRLKKNNASRRIQRLAKRVKSVLV